jgi:16S rRNA (cytosine967-C5)-methyltransferase
VTPASHALPLSQLLLHAAGLVQGVLDGRSLGDLVPVVPAPARPGAQALAFEALRRLGSTRGVCRSLAPKAPPPPLQGLLLVALALLWPARVGSASSYAEHTVVDQAVAATRQRAPRAAAFVNAVLRRFLRERDALVATAEQTPEGEFNHPRWWIERLRHDWPAQWRAMLAAAARHPPMTLRVNARRSDAAAYLQRLADECGLGARVLGPHTLVLDNPCPVTRLPGFAEGEVSVQDAAAQRAAPLLLGLGSAPLPPHARVLDACAAPGGKTAHLLELAEVEVLALDSDAARLARVQESLDRLRLAATLRAADASRPQDWWDGRPYDAILLDAPCSASGIGRRHPDIRWLRRPADIAALARTQDALLDALWPLLKPGGRLLYATCSVWREEGQARIDAFLQRQGVGSARLDPASPGHLLGLPDNELAGPAAVSEDGFFYALIHK